MHYLGTIPSPSFKSLELGPLSFRVYGLAVDLAAFAGICWFAVYVTGMGSDVCGLKDCGSIAPRSSSEFG